MRRSLLVATVLSSLAPTCHGQCPSSRLVYDARYDHVAGHLGLLTSPGAVVTDFDGRNGPDVIIANMLIYATQVFLNNGTGVLVRHDIAVPRWSYQGAAAGDIDLDGKLDLIVLPPGAAIMTLIGDGRGNFEVEPFGKRCADVLWGKSVACADFDGDGWVDLFIGMIDTYQSRIYLNDRRGKFVDATFTHLPWPILGCVQKVVSADLDGDRDLDLVLAMGGVCGPKHENVVLLNDGRGRFTPVSLAGRVHWSLDVAVGDVTGDGLPDLVFVNGRDPAELWVNVGGGQFVDVTSRVPTGSMDFRYSAAVVDVDGDGRNDILTGSGQSNQVELWQNTGTGPFVSRSNLIQQPANLQAYYLHPADMDRDGDLDLVVGGHTTPTTGPVKGLKVFVNTHRHILPARAPTIGSAWQVALHAKPNQVVLPALATSQTTIDLGPLGILGLDPASLVPLGPIDMQQTCSKTTTVPIPNVRALRGHSIYAQALVFDLGNPANTRLTNWTADVIE